MAFIGKVVELWRYPVSSLAGERVEILDASAEGGVSCDRDFAVVDAQTGEVASPGKVERWRPALGVEARAGIHGMAQVRLDGGTWVDVLSPEASDMLSGYFGFRVEIRPYANRAKVGNYHGAWTTNRYQPSALHFLTTASIAELQRLHPQGNPDRRRFRPNIVVEMPPVEGSFPETEWLGGRVRIGDMSMSIDEPTRRCGMTVIAQGDIPHDPEILRQLVRRNEHNIGVYCSPFAAGTLQVGDEVHLE